jgi:hypothetical protein
MNRKLSKITIAGLILALILTLAAGTAFALPPLACDPAYVNQAGSDITVKPTGVDDTANLQCAFDAAAAAGPGTNVRLEEGTYHTAQIVVNDFNGQFSGAGVEKTRVLPLPDLFVAWEFFLQPPSADNPYPILFSFFDGDYSISDMAFRVIGEKPTLGWEVFGMQFYELACVIAVAGTEAHADIIHVLIEGEHMADSIFGYNLINGIYPQGFMDWIAQPPPPITGTFQVTFSTFRRIGFGTPLFNLDGATVMISHNVFEDMYMGMEVVDMVNSSLEFSHNSVTSAIFGLYVYNSMIEQSTGSTFLIKNNKFSGIYGIVVEPIFGEGNRCLLLGNNVHQVSEIGVYLGEGTYGCTVVGGSNKTNVLDLGTDNVLVGVNNMGTGVGPQIAALMRKH